jgi:DNA-binding YbaB/EbfC family protein
MMGNMGNMGRMLKKMQADMARVQQELQERTTVGSAGSGAVTVEVSGSLEVRKVTLSPDILDPSDPDLVADLVAAATNDALRRAQEMAAAEMAKVTGGLGLPGMPRG